MIRYSGTKITLRDWQLEDLDHHAYWLQPGHRWKEFDGPYYAGPSLAEIPEIIARYRKQIEFNDMPTPRTSLIITERQQDTMLGIVTWHWESVETYWPQVGITIFDPVYWHKGIGYEALGLWSDYLFHSLPQIVRLDLRTWSGNIGMMRLAEKLGYREEARFRKARIVQGHYYDGMGYGLLREEWAAQYPNGFAQWLKTQTNV